MLDFIKEQLNNPETIAVLIMFGVWAYASRFEIFQWTEKQDLSAFADQESHVQQNPLSDPRGN